MENWMQAAGQLAQAGLPSLGSLIGSITGGPLGGTIGGAVGRGAAAAIGAALGVAPTPEAITQAVAADPAGAQIKLSAIEAEDRHQEHRELVEAIQGMSCRMRDIRCAA